MTLAGKVIIKIKAPAFIIHKSWCIFATKEKKYSSISGFMYVFYGPAAWLRQVLKAESQAKASAVEHATLGMEGTLLAALSLGKC